VSVALGELVLEVRLDLFELAPGLVRSRVREQHLDLRESAGRRLHARVMLAGVEVRSHGIDRITLARVPVVHRSSDAAPVVHR
jgi:hypothetical protein